MADSKVASEDEFRYAIGENMLCIYGPSIYEAKCLLREKTIEGVSVYYVHYKGWRSTWNEWVCRERLLDINEVNIKKMEMLKQNNLKLKKDKQPKKGRRSKTTKPSIIKRNQLSTKTRVEKIDNAIPKYNKQLKNKDISQMINGTSDVQLNLSNKSTTILKKENACNELPIGEKKEYIEAANSNVISAVNNLSSESKGKKRGQPPKTFPTKIKKEKACNTLHTKQKNLCVCEPAISSLIPNGNNLSSEVKGEKRGQPSKTLPTKIKKEKVCNKLHTAQKNLCVCEPAISSLIPNGNNLSSEAKGEKKGQSSKTLPTKIKKEKACNKLHTPQKNLSILEEQACSSLIPQGNNLSSEAKGEKKGQSSKTLPTKIKKEKACNKLHTPQKNLSILEEQACSSLIPQGNNLSSEAKGEKKGQSSKTLPTKIKKEKACNKLHTPQKNLSILEEQGCSSLIPQGNDSSSESEGEKIGQSSKTLPTKIKKEKACNKLHTPQKNLSILEEQGCSSLIPQGNDSSSESEGEKIGKSSKTLPTKIKKGKVCNKLRTAHTRRCTCKKPAFSNLIPKGNNSSSSSKSKSGKKGQPSKTLQTKIKKGKACKKLHTAEKKMSILKEPACSSLIPQENNSSSESEGEKRGKSKTLPTKIKIGEVSNKLRIAPKKMCSCNEPACSNSILKGNNSSSESEGEKRGKSFKTLPTKIKIGEVSNKLRIAPKKMCSYNEPACSNSILKGNNSSSESEGEKRGKSSKTLPTKIKIGEVSNKLRIAPKKICSCIEPACSNSILKGNNSSSESKGKKRRLPSKTLSPKSKKVCKSTPIAKRNLKSNNESTFDTKSVNVIDVTSLKRKVENKGETSKTLPSKSKNVCESTHIAKVRQCKSKSTHTAEVRQGKLNTPNSELAEENKGHTLIEETHKGEMPPVNMWTQSTTSLETNENVPSTSQLTENIKPTCSKILIPKPEEPDIIDLTEDDEIDTKSNISAVKESNKSVIMNIFITSQNGEIKKHIISVL